MSRLDGLTDYEIAVITRALDAVMDRDDGDWPDDRPHVVALWREFDDANIERIERDVDR